MSFAYVIIAVILRVLSNPLANVFQKKLTAAGRNPLVVNLSTYAILSVACLLFVFQFAWLQLPKEFWLYSLLGGAVGASGNSFLVKALERGDLSVLGPVNSYKSIVAMITGFFMLGEVPNIYGLLGVAIIIYGSYFVIDTMPEGFSWKVFKRKDIQYRIWAMILTAIEAVIIKKIIIVSSVTIAFISWCWFGALFSVFILYLQKINIKAEVSKTGKVELYYFLLIAICVGIMQFATNFSFQHIQVGYALSFFQLSIIVSVLLGYKIFKEENLRKKLIGSVVMIAGAVLIILSQ